MNRQDYAVFLSTRSISSHAVRLTQEQERSWFRIIWHQEPGDRAEARQTVVLANVPLVSILARRFSVLYELEYDDLFQYGCQILLECVDRVPLTCEHPGKWLYRCVEKRLIDVLDARKQDLCTCGLSLDRDRDRDLSLSNILVQPDQDSDQRHDRLERRQHVLYEAIGRLSTRQREAVCQSYDIPLSEIATHATPRDRQRDYQVREGRDPLNDRRKRAYQSLRRDPHLLAFIEQRGA